MIRRTLATLECTAQVTTAPRTIQSTGSPVMAFMKTRAPGALRKLALRLMQDLAQFQPFLTGAVLNGTAGEHSDIYLQLFSDSPKDVEIYLLNRNIKFEVSESAHFKEQNKLVETLSFMWHNEGVHLVLYQHHDLRGAVKNKAGGRRERAGIDTLQALIGESEAV